MTETKACELPNLPLVAQSDLQLLIRRLIEYADISAIPAVADELLAQGRLRDYQRLKEVLSDYAARITCTEAPIRWRWVGETLTQLFWVDLFGWEGITTALTGNVQREDEVFEAGGVAPPMADTLLYQATEAIPAGSMVRLEYNPATVRLATAEEVAGE